MKQANLILHCGAAKVERVEVANVITPKPTRTWFPIPHLSIIELIEETLQTNGLKVITAAHSLTKDGMRYFGLMQIQNGSVRDDYTWVLGIRNSHDKVFPAGLAAGASVFVCDNLSFSGEVKLARKHTPNILRDLPRLTQSTIGRLMDRWHHQDQRMDAYKNTNLSDTRAHDLIVRSLDVQAITVTRVPDVLQEWRKPSHEEFAGRTVWSLFNAFTEVLKAVNLNELPGRTERLHGLLDNYVKLPEFQG